MNHAKKLMCCDQDSVYSEMFDLNFITHIEAKMNLRLIQDVDEKGAEIMICGNLLLDFPRSAVHEVDLHPRWRFLLAGLEHPELVGAGANQRSSVPWVWIKTAVFQYKIVGWKWPSHQGVGLIGRQPSVSGARVGRQFDHELLAWSHGQDFILDGKFLEITNVVQ